MADEPKNADELLKRYAEERRKEPVPDIHPSTRNALQGEVTRVYGRQTRPIPWWRKYLLSPQVGWAAGLVAILGISLLVQREPPTEPATTTEDLLKRVDQPQPEKSPKELPEIKAKDEMELKPTRKPAGAVEARQDKANPAPVVPPPATLPAPTAPQRVTATDSPTVRLRREPEARSRTSSEKKSEAPTFEFSNAAAVNNSRAQNAEVARALGNAVANNSDVLNRFSMTQVGANVRFKDADGSAYTGQVLTLRDETSFFKAQGTNLSLKQQVVFTGQISRAVAPGQQPAGAQKSNQQVRLAAEQMRVQGLATVGATNQIPVDAQSAAPAR